MPIGEVWGKITRIISWKHEYLVVNTKDNKTTAWLPFPLIFSPNRPHTQRRLSTGQWKLRLFSKIWSPLVKSFQARGFDLGHKKNWTRILSWKPRRFNHLTLGAVFQTVCHQVCVPRPGGQLFMQAFRSFIHGKFAENVEKQCCLAKGCMSSMDLKNCQTNESQPRERITGANRFCGTHRGWGND